VHGVATDDVELALWRFLSQIDLATTLVRPLAPPEPLLRWRLTEPRQLRIDAQSDLVWARLLDVAAVLGARSYAAAGTLVLGVHDPFRPSTGGTFHLRAGGPGTPASCTRASATVDADADVTTTIAELSSIALGGVAPSLLARAGRLQAATPEALRLADALFVTHPAPWCPLEF
jgi:predicted acetyltransferase